MQTSTEHLLAAARERFALQDYYGAAHLLEELTASGNAFADAHHLLGLCLSLLDQPQRALAEFDTALELNPRYLEALLHRGLVLTALGRADDAEESFRRAAAVATGDERFPGQVAAQLANKHAELGEMYSEAGHLREAVAQYRRALKLAPAFHDLRYRLARHLIAVGSVLEAREELERVMAARPGFLDAHAMLGLARYLAGDGVGARQVWTECLARRPEDARLEAYLAMLGRADE